jgi:hypothetical protein
LNYRITMMRRFSTLCTILTTYVAKNWLVSRKHNPAWYFDDKSSTYRTKRRKTQREEREEASIDVRHQKVTYSLVMSPSWFFLSFQRQQRLSDARQVEAKAARIKVCCILYVFIITSFCMMSILHDYVCRHFQVIMYVVIMYVVIITSLCMPLLCHNVRCCHYNITMYIVIITS